MQIKPGVNVVAIAKPHPEVDQERYIFLYDDESVREVLQHMGRFAADPDLSFTWADACICSQKVQKIQANK